MENMIPKQSEGNGGEVRAEQFLNGSPGVNPLVKASEFSKLNHDAHMKQPFNPASVQNR